MTNHDAKKTKCRALFCQDYAAPPSTLCAACQKFSKKGECTHPIFRYMGASYWCGDKYEQRYCCIDCGHEEHSVPYGAVMVGHAPGECQVCDESASALPPDQRQRWVEITAERRGTS